MEKSLESLFETDYIVSFAMRGLPVTEVSVKAVNPEKAVEAVEEMVKKLPFYSKTFYTVRRADEGRRRFNDDEE